MRALFDKLAFAHDVDAVRVFDGGEAMGDGDDCAAFGSLVQSVLNDTLAVGIKSAGLRGECRISNKDPNSPI